MIPWNLELSNRQWNQFCNFCMSDPIHLAEADLSKSFVYARKHGVFYVPGGYHQSAMSFLLAIDHGCEDGIDVGVKLNLDYSNGTADYWLEHTPGAAFKSSVGKTIQIANGKNLTPLERRLFKDATKVFE